MSTHSSPRLKKPPVAGVFFLFLTAVMLCAALWYISVFGNVGCEAILFTLSVGMEGVQGGMITGYLLRSLLPALALGALLSAAIYLPRRLPRPFKKALTILLCLGMGVSAVFLAELPQYVAGLFQHSTLYEEEYADPAQVAVAFPEKKRNLIYIYLESMETTFFSADEGGAEPQSRIPELYALAQENVNFSQTGGIGGGRSLRGATWTMGAMIAHTAGLPMRLKIGSAWQTRMPGAITLGDILHENGYYQALMVGSDARYGGRAQYYTQHQTDRINDLYPAREEGIVPPDYWVWWGMEDKRLCAYAQSALTELAAQEQPFAFTLLTADTHHVGGYACDACGSAYKEQYDNVLACSSRQVAAFIRWIQQQDFYENTTIIITGDHPTMDNGYITRNIDKSYVRRVYNCFINAAATDENTKNRQFSTMDMFPTTLAALGCHIEGEHLGLGVNLFSGEQTLLERFSEKELNARILKHSDWYEDFMQQ